MTVNTTMDSWFLDVQLMDGLTMQLLFSKVIGYSVLVMSSLFVKLPQLTKIMKERNADGISYVGELLLLLVSCNSLSYNVFRGYPISTWGESLSLTVQELITGYCILTYTRRSSAAVVHVLGVLIYIALLFSPAFSESIHVAIQLLAVPMVSSSKLIQIRTNWMRGSSGQLSRASSIAMSLRTAGRFTTSLIETGDAYLIARYAILTALNLTILAQIWYYSSTKRSEDKSK